jgi:ABC-2 type transport system permease protein
VIAPLHAIFSVATKEFLHIWRDRRIVVLLLLLPPFFTLLFGHAFEAGSITGVPVRLVDRDRSTESRQLTKTLEADDTFAWTHLSATSRVDSLPKDGSAAALLTIPEGWGKSLAEGKPAPLRLLADGSDTNTAVFVEGTVRKALGEFQLDSRQETLGALPPEVAEVAQQLPLEVQNRFTSMMEPWEVDTKILYNPELKFINFVIPGIIGLILQLLSVTLMACTITREREAGTFSQLMVTSLRRTEIVIGKVLPYLGISMLLIAMTIAVGHLHFGVQFRQPAILALICVLFLLSSLGLGLLISAFSHNQTQAIQFAVFFLLPVFPLSGAFASLDQLPAGIRVISNTFPLTHFCRAFRQINMRDAAFAEISGELLFLTAATVITCVGAALLLRRTSD